MSDLEKQVREQAVERAVENLVGDSNSYNRSQLIGKIEDEVARRVADLFWEKHQLELIAGLDLDAITRLTTLKLISKITDGLGRL